MHSSRSEERFSSLKPTRHYHDLYAQRNQSILESIINDKLKSKIEELYSIENIEFSIDEEYVEQSVALFLFFLDRRPTGSYAEFYKIYKNDLELPDDLDTIGWLVGSQYRIDLLKEILNKFSYMDAKSALAAAYMEYIKTKFEIVKRMYE